MVQRTAEALAALYEADETAWLEATAELVRLGCLDQLDTANLAEYLTDMAKRDRREVESRLRILLAHLLKWRYQADRRTSSWQTTILDQQFELAGGASRGVLRNHAEAVLAEVYDKAVVLAAAETQLPMSAFPTVCPFTVSELLTADLFADS